MCTTKKAPPNTPENVAALVFFNLFSTRKIKQRGITIFRRKKTTLVFWLLAVNHLETGYAISLSLVLFMNLFHQQVEKWCSFFCWNFSLPFCHRTTAPAAAVTIHVHRKCYSFLTWETIFSPFFGPIELITLYYVLVRNNKCDVFLRQCKDHRSL